MTLYDLVKELVNLYGENVPADTEIIFFTKNTTESEDGRELRYEFIQMDDLTISMNGNCIQFLLQ